MLHHDVAEHYDTMCRVQTQDGHRSATTSEARIRRVNNQAKAHLIDQVCHEFANDVKNEYRPNWLCLGHGKGGDQHKLLGQVEVCAGIDISHVSLTTAIQRFREEDYQRKHQSRYVLFEGDAFAGETITSMRKQLGGMSFDIVSCQFALHYATQSLPEIMARVVRASGGRYFLATIVDGNVLTQHVNNTAVDDHGWTDSSGQVRVEWKDAPPSKTGDVYQFTFGNGVQGCTERLICFADLESAAFDAGFRIVEGSRRNLAKWYLSQDQQFRARFPLSDKEIRVLELYMMFYMKRID